jgi:hypothetical protein
MRQYTKRLFTTSKWGLAMATVLLTGCTGNQRELDARLVELESRVSQLESPVKPRPFRSTKLVPRKHVARTEKFLMVLQMKMDGGDVAPLAYHRARLFLDKLLFLRNELSPEDYEARVKKHREMLDRHEAAQRESGRGGEMNFEKIIADAEAQLAENLLMSLVLNFEK